MKMFKRLAAVVLAAVMSMAVLTACGGGSGSSGNKMTNIMSGDKFYIDYTDLDDGSRTIEAASAKGIYIKNVDEDGTYQYWYKDGMCYDVMRRDGETVAWKYKADGMEMGVSSTGSLLQNVKVNPAYEIKKLGKTYYAEIVEIEEGIQLAYCFEGNKLVYMVEVYGGEEHVCKVNEYKNTFDDSLLELPAGVDFKDLK